MPSPWPLLLTLLLLSNNPLTTATHHHPVHHMSHPRPPTVLTRSQSTSPIPLVITNLCTETIYPGIATQAGTAPSSQGFELKPNDSMNQTVSADWQGRVWGRTNCSFSGGGIGNGNGGGAGQACGTGDCNGQVDCQATGDTPVSLAEFTLSPSTGQSFYDISLVDGYNLAMAISSLNDESGDPTLEQIPPNLTNPVCIGTAGLLQAQNSPQSPGDLTLGSNASFPLPLDQSQSQQDVAQWCPWDLQLNAPTSPASGVYTYPEANIQRPDFDPCYSACAKYNDPQDCCTGAFDTSATCKPNYYSIAAKMVCPDAYSYAYDDQTSTFVIPFGGGFQVIFCPAGRSTNIQATMGPQLRALGQEKRLI